MALNKNRKITKRLDIDLTEEADKAISGLAKLNKSSIPDFIRYSIYLGGQVTKAYELGGEVIARDRQGKELKLLSPKDYLKFPH